MAYGINCGIGAVASVQTFVLDGLAANPTGIPPPSTRRRGMQGRGRARLRGRRLFWLLLALSSGWSA